MDFKIRLAEVLSEILDDSAISIQYLTQIIKKANKNIEADFAINSFALKKYIKRSGLEIAQEIHKSLSLTFLNQYPFIQAVFIDGPYLNFKLNKKIIGKEVLKQIFEDVNSYASSNFIKKKKKPERIVIEYPAPNTNKPLHLGHIRNMLLGQTLSKINKCANNEVFQVNLFNDRGIHICKSMWAYDKFGENKTPESENIKPDHFVGNYYIKFAQEESRLKKYVQNKMNLLEYELKKNPEDQDIVIIQELRKNIDRSKYGILQNDLKEMLIAWEKEDKNVRILWRKMNDWAENGFNQTFNTFKIHHDKTYFESKIYNKGKKIVENGIKEGIFEKLDDGAVIINFHKKKLPKQKVLIRKDGTSLYITQDLHLAYQKMEDFNYTKSIYVIGNEQDMQLRVLFEILEKLGMKAENIHYSYGMINLTSGKMKSREGTIVDADDIVEELKLLALKEVQKRYSNLTKDEMEKRALVIALASLRFFIIKYDYSRDFVFDPKKSLEFEGETGPYILYSYARICSIFKKAMEKNIETPYNPIKEKIAEKGNIENLSLLENEHEFKLIELLYSYPEIISNSVNQMKPHILARYLYELAQEFTGFYHSCPIIKEKPKLRKLRLFLCESIRRVLKHGLGLLTIDVLTEM
ncbi:arginine--tRNA ligase [Promethearchaeum syntrophicum]|uniref:Arginine--tRNA ligase n=1 Tax=Promethearchaeum syntrophicum TaxID=2594042 RepID=A0A5B9D9F6_9ARCH|nr:arginine--tRNA ligase [Candidatus Prometheoarchaeum syntrophicum]QEE15487.1 Arginine--tRNA ligase [Candidatus Prometheoarchaeum syntrophicum]